MATNNRIVDYNLRNIKVQDTAFQNFLTNIQASANSYNINALKECHAKLPLEWRDSDEIYLAGAWNVGNIFGYDQSGSIVNFPFNRSTVGWAWRDIDMYEAPIDAPIIDGFYITRDWGLVLENERVGDFYNSEVYGGWVGVNRTANTATSHKFNTWMIIRESATDGPHWYGLRSSSSNIPILSHLVWVDYTDLSENRKLFIGNAFDGASSIRIGVLLNPSIGIVEYSDGCVYTINTFLHNGRKVALIQIDNTRTNTYINDLRFTFLESIGQNVNILYTGDTANSIRTSWLTRNSSKSYIKSLGDRSNVDTIKGEDVLTINITQTSDIFINTSKGAFVFRNQPTGIFDYKANGVIDCKVYNIAIKHV